MLEQLRLLTNLETDTQKLLRIILIGQPELRDTLQIPELTQVSQRITSRYHLTPLQVEDVANYIQHRINMAGCQRNLFSAKAIKVAEKRSRGIPRLINILCDHALLGAYAESADRVDHKIMKKASREVFAKCGKDRSVRIYSVMTLALVSIFIGCIIYYFPALIAYTGNGDRTLVSPAKTVIAGEIVSKQTGDDENALNTNIDGPPVLHADKSKIKYSPSIYKEHEVSLGEK